MKLYIVDAFAEKPFTGNPAAVCYLSQWPDDALMQQIAAENNLSETAFIVKEKGGRYAIRWFTPKYEIDLCGHATLASAYVLHRFADAEQPEVLFSSRSGDLAVECRDGLYTLDFPSRPADSIRQKEDIERALGVPVQEAYLSRDIMAVVENETLVKALKPDFRRLKLLIGDGMIVTAKGNNCDFVSRCFYPKCGVNEDPVTGSAHCNLIPYWSERLQKKEMTAKQLSERGGTLYCRDAGDRVFISGNAVLYSIAELQLGLEWN